jgi:site-specific recombinase
MNRIAKFITDHSAGIGGNMTLGFLLAMVPVTGLMFGIPLDVRHITLSTGALTFSVMSLGGDSLTIAPILGIAIIGLCNFGVSFALALTVALRAREVTTRERVDLAVSVFREFLRRPHHFFYPPKDPPGRAATPPPH